MNAIERTYQDVVASIGSFPTPAEAGRRAALQGDVASCSRDAEARPLTSDRRRLCVLLVHSWKCGVLPSGRLGVVASIGYLLAGWLRTRAVTGILIALVLASFVLTLLAPLFHWPPAVLQLSIFEQYGAPLSTVSGAIAYLDRSRWPPLRSRPPWSVSSART